MKQKWLDFAAYDLKMRMVKAPSGGYYLVLGGPNAKQFAGTAANHQFRAHSNNPEVLHRTLRMSKDGVLEEVIVTERLRKDFPLAQVIDYDEAQHFVDNSGVKPAADNAEASAQRVASSSGAAEVGVRVGRNKFGFDVFEGERGRWVRDDRARFIYETETPNPVPGQFLRGKDHEDLVASAEGFLEDLNRIRGGAGDFDYAGYVKAVFGKEDIAKKDAATARKAIGQAVIRWFARQGRRAMQEAFLDAGKLQDRVSQVENVKDAFVGTAAPIGIASQRLLGTEALLRDKKVVASVSANGVAVTHLPRTSDLQVFVQDEETASIITSVMAAAGLKSKAVVAAANFEGADAVLIDQPRRVAARRSKAGGISFTRQDYAEVVRALSSRNDEGVATLVLDAPANDEELKELQALRGWIAANAYFESEAVMGPELVESVGAGAAKHILAIGGRRPEPAAGSTPPEEIQIADWALLWTWTAEIVAARSRFASIEREKIKVDLNEGDPNLARNSFQAPYVSASKTSTPTTMVPRNLEGATREALARVVRLYGDIDAHVAKEFGYTQAELKEIFSPEQIDALALYTYAEQRNRGYLVADMTGIGKGRTLAAIMRRNALNGRPSFFLTEREQNLSDIWRDICRTKSDHLFKPFIMNSDAKVIDPMTKEIVLRGNPRDDEMMKSMELPEQYNLVLGTYSQINREAKTPVSLKEGEIDPSLKSRWFISACAKGRVIMDESHNASGDSNVSDNCTAAIEASSAPVYSSATFAKDAKRMAFYAPLFPDNLSVSDLATMMERGGEIFQEVISSMLVHDGVMIRREFDNQKVTYETVHDLERYDRNRAWMDSIAPVLAEMASLNAAVDARIAALNEQRNNARRARRQAVEAAAVAEDEAAGLAAGDDANDLDENGRRRAKPFQLARIGFGSPLYTITRLFVAALKIDVVAEDAIKILQEGGKPVILVENTMQQLLEEIAEDADQVEGTVSVDFRALFNRALRKMTTTTYKDPSGAQHVSDMVSGDPALAARAAKVRRMIEQMPDVPVSVIDEVKSRVEASGFTMGEITGRSLEVRDGRVMRRPGVNSVVVKNQFNDGEIDGLIINIAGSTGIDLHASVTFQDQRQRYLLELQPPADITRKLQTHGRVNRYDQVVDPIVRSYVSGLPVEMRLSAMENAKLRRLSANTTSNRDSVQISRDIPDLINPIGDMVCSRYAEARPELMRRLGFKVSDIVKMGDDNIGEDNKAAEALAKAMKDVKAAGTETFKVTDTKRTANEIMARLIMLPVDMQTRVCSELTAEFQAAIEEMEARGETPLKTQDLQGIVHERQKTIFDGAELETPDSVFDEPLYLMEGALERTGEPIKADDLAQKIALGEMASGRAPHCIDYLKRNWREILEAYLPNGVPTVEEALNRGIAEVVRRKARIDTLVANLEKLAPGKGIVFTIDGEKKDAIVTRVEYPNRGDESVPSLYAVEFVSPGDEKARMMRLETLIKDPNFSINEGLASEKYDTLLKSYDQAVLTKLSKVRIMTHNIYRAMRINVEHKLGTLSSYVSADGTRHRGLVMAGRNLDINKVPVEATGDKMAVEAILAGHELVGASGLVDKSLAFSKISSGGIEIRLPPQRSRKLGFIYDSKKILDLLRRASVDDRGQQKVVVAKDELPEIMKALYRSGGSLWMSPLARKWALEWTTKNAAQDNDGPTNDGPQMRIA